MKALQYSVRKKNEEMKKIQQNEWRKEKKKSTVE